MLSDGRGDVVSKKMMWIGILIMLFHSITVPASGNRCDHRVSSMHSDTLIIIVYERYAKGEKRVIGLTVGHEANVV